MPGRHPIGNRRLAEHRCDHAVVDSGRERETALQHSPITPTPLPGVFSLRSRPEPAESELRTVRVRREGCEFLCHTTTQHHRTALAALLGHREFPYRDGQATVKPLSTRWLPAPAHGMDARHLRDQDHPGPSPLR